MRVRVCVLGEGREGDGQQETVLYRYQHSVTCDVRPAASRLDDAMKETVRSPCTVLMKQRIDAHEDTLKKKTLMAVFGQTRRRSGQSMKPTGKDVEMEGWVGEERKTDGLGGCVCGGGG